ncbi:MAG: hypothetical protein LBC35_08320 [Coriobacteriales bacterium]|jgi:Flp pilus assembly protein TadB|nr:hypothetical protein [Coriobacteriales bacterium]
MAEKHDQVRYDKGKEDVRDYVAQATEGIQDVQEARQAAREALDDFKQDRAEVLEQTAKRFKLTQRLEFIVGALAILQLGIWALFQREELSPLIFTIAACFVFYLVVAILDSKAKGARQDILYQIKAAKKAKFRAGDDGTGVKVDFD